MLQVVNSSQNVFLTFAAVWKQLRQNCKIEDGPLLTFAAVQKVSMDFSHGCLHALKNLP